MSTVRTHRAFEPIKTKFDPLAGARQSHLRVARLRARPAPELRGAERFSVQSFRRDRRVHLEGPITQVRRSTEVRQPDSIEQTAMSDPAPRTQEIECQFDLDGVRSSLPHGDANCSFCVRPSEYGKIANYRCVLRK